MSRRDGGAPDPALWTRRLHRLRLAIYAVLLAAIGYALWRFEVVTLPAEGCSPLVGFEPGDRLLVDRSGGVGLGTAVLYEGPGGELLLGRVVQPPGSAPAAVWSAFEAGELWIVSERDDCPGRDSHLLGTQPRSAVRGTVVVGLP